jgi:hypothetical protein
MTKVLAAAVAALVIVISVPASAQTQQPSTHPPQPPYRPPIHPPGPPIHPPRPPHPPGHHPPGNYSSGRVFEQQPVYPQFVYPPFVGLCVTDVGTCQVFRAPGSYCECKNWIGEVFGGQVQ